MKKIINTITKWLFILCIPIILLTVNVAVAVNSQWFYEYGFEKYDVGETTGLDKTELERIAGEIIVYFNSGEEYISITATADGESFTLFDEEETFHMKDVKALIWLDYYVMLAAIIYALAYAGFNIFHKKDRNFQPVASSLFMGSGITVGLIVLLGIMALVDFDSLFWTFHLISFSNDYWLLPATDYLIMLFPEGFWYDAVLLLVSAIAVMAIIAGFISWRYLKKLNRGSFSIET